MVFAVFRALTTFGDLPPGQKLLRVVGFPYFLIAWLVSPAPKGAAVPRAQRPAATPRNTAVSHPALLDDSREQR